MTLLTKAALALALLAGTAHAETTTTGHDMMMMAVPEGATEATRGYVDAMNKMSMAMAAEFTGNADRDYASGHDRPTGYSANSSQYASSIGNCRRSHSASRYSTELACSLT